MRLCLAGRAALGGALGLVLFSEVAAAANDVQDGSGARGSRWQEGVVRLTVDESIDQVDGAALEALVDVVTAWQSVDAELPTLVVQRGESTSLGYHVDSANTNSVVFAPEGIAKANGAVAITITTFDLEKGEILDADIVLNGEYRFRMMTSPAGDDDAYDLQNVLTHEVGHFLGLGEEYDDEQATMFAFSRPGETRKRQLASTDSKTVTSLYYNNSARVGSANCAANVTGKRSTPGFGFVCIASLLSLNLYQARRRALRAALWSLTSASGILLGLWVPAEEFPQATVAALNAHWESGVIVTTAQLTPSNCPSCAPVAVQLLGGRVGSIEQRVGMLRPLLVGDQIKLGASP